MLPFVFDEHWKTYKNALTIGDFQKAYTIAQNAAHFYEQREDFKRAGGWLLATGHSLLYQGNFKEGAIQYQRAVHIQPDPYLQARASHGLALISAFASNYKLSFDALHQSEEIARSFKNDAYLKGSNHGLRGYLCLITGDTEQAIIDFKKASDLMLRSETPDASVQYLNNTGYCMVLTQQYREAEAYLIEAFQSIDSATDFWTKAGTHDSFGYLLTRMKKYDEAQQFLKKALNAFESVSNKPWALEACLHLSELYERTRQYKDSRDYAKRAMNIAADTTFDKMWVEARAQLTKIEAVISRLSKKPTSFHGIIYTGSAMQMVISRLKTIAATDEIALILGETGTGKELAARALHRESRRCNSPFIPFNCSALSRDLIESRLFGHRKGAFTGADRDQTGVIRAAEGGTLFLDEIGDLSLEAQGALLRFLQSGEIQPVGASLPVRANVRVIAATNRDLKQEVEAGRFRSDLYYRLNVATVLLPPLRFRAGDINALAHHFAEVYSAEYNMPVTYLSHAEIARLSEYDWPGNIRELENFIKRRLLFGEQEIEPNASSLAVYSINWRKLSEDQKQQRLIEALGRNGGNMTLAARELGLSRRAVQKIRQRGKAM